MRRPSDPFTDDPLRAPRGFAIAAVIMFAFVGVLFLAGLMWTALPDSPTGPRVVDAVRLP